MPPATAGPSTAAITGFDSSSRDGPSGPRGGLAAVLGEVEGADRIVLVEVRHRLQVPAGAEGAALAPEHRDMGAVVGIELLEGRHQIVGAPGVHGVARLGAAVDDGPDGAGFLDANGHGVSSGVPGLGCR